MILLGIKLDAEVQLVGLMKKACNCALQSRILASATFSKFSFICIDCDIGFILFVEFIIHSYPGEISCEGG